MRKYGMAAVTAVRFYTNGTADNINRAWEIAVSEVFPNSVSSQEKGCPKGTFLGLCESGRVAGVPPGQYTRSEKNKLYGLKALDLLVLNPELAHNEAALWQRLMAGQSKKANSQMDVVASLWNANLLTR